MVPCKSTAKEVSFEWSHHRISSTDSKVRTTRHVFIIDSGSQRVNKITNKEGKMLSYVEVADFSPSIVCDTELLSHVQLKEKKLNHENTLNVLNQKFRAKHLLLIRKKMSSGKKILFL